MESLPALFEMASLCCGCWYMFDLALAARKKPVLLPAFSPTMSEQVGYYRVLMDSLHRFLPMVVLFAALLAIARPRQPSKATGMRPEASHDQTNSAKK